MNTTPKQQTTETTTDAEPMSMARLASPAFIIGVTGNMDPVPQAGAKDPFEHVKEPIRKLFRYLRGVEGSRAGLDSLLAHADFAAGLEGWQGLGVDTPIVLLTSLAPGADTLAAQVALEEEFVKLKFHVRAPLPFPKEHYPKASTFRLRETDKAPAKELLAVFDDLVGKICSGNPEHAFPVLLKDDPRTDAERGKLFKADLNDPARQNLRYQAAGEYVVAQSDLLSAIWDDDFPSTNEVGTAAMVEVKRRGPASELLPETTALTWADSGPVFHLHFRRLKCVAKGNEPDPQREGKLRILHPYELGPADATLRKEIALLWDPEHPQAAEREAFCRWQVEGNRRFTRIAALLAEFNQTKVPTVEAVNEEFQKRTGDCASNLQESMGAAFASLQGLCAVQRRAGDENRRLATCKRRGMAVVFLLTLVAAMLLHLFAHWYPQMACAHAGAIRCCLAFAALICVAVGLVVFWLQRGKRTEEKTHDYRALAEGVRVQVAWCLAGLDSSVAANYMQRQRGELDWIRTAISSATAPYPRWADWFRKLSRKGQLLALKCVKQSWIDEQTEYHRKTSKVRLDDLHFFHRLGGVLALAGLGHVPLHLLALGTGFCGCLVGRSGKCGCVGLCLLASLFAVWLFSCVIEIVENGEKYRPLTCPRNLAAALWQAFKRMILTLVPVPREQNQLDLKMRRRNMLYAFLGHLPLGLVVLATAISLDHWVAASARWWPEASSLMIVSMGFCFVSGTLAVAWAERTLLSEEAYQYNAMASLFASGGQEMEQLLQTLEATLKQPETFDQNVARTQDLILALGREALAENAEWLILHRARPMEPVMAG
ncbi:MAG: hypothetical protein NTW21_22395 [Verrucomicrobia bacterium]|nr:hypothetical protein [Verrucomicrobiota bacterium]